MNELHLFAGCGGDILAGELLGRTCVCAVERNEYCRRILVERQNNRVIKPFPIWDDIKTFNGRDWRGNVDLVSGGFPCQAFSNAASGKNNAENLWKEMLRVIGQAEPRFVFAENVSEDAIIEAQADLEVCGFKTSRCQLSAADLGADHIRRRWWLFGDAYGYSESGCPKHDEAQGLQKLCSGVWKSYEPQRGMANGLASELERNRAIGNGQVPIVAALAWRILSREI